MLTLLEEVVLLAVDEKTGELTSARECWTEYALAAAVLFDLALAGKIDTDTEEITIDRQRIRRGTLCSTMCWPRWPRSRN